MASPSAEKVRRVPQIEGILSFITSDNLTTKRRRVYLGGADKATDTGYGIRDGGSEVEGLCFMAHAFSPNGKYVFRTPYSVHTRW